MDQIGDHLKVRLDYAVVVGRTIGEEDVVYFAKGAKFFTDEQGFQWCSFVPSNGYQQGKEHMIRTDCDGFMVVRDELASDE